MYMFYNGALNLQLSIKTSQTSLQMYTKQQSSLAPQRSLLYRPLVQCSGQFNATSAPQNAFHRDFTSARILMGSLAARQKGEFCVLTGFKQCSYSMIATFPIQQTNNSWIRIRQLVRRGQNLASSFTMTSHLMIFYLKFNHNLNRI